MTSFDFGAVDGLVDFVVGFRVALVETGGFGFVAVVVLVADALLTDSR